MPRRSFPSTSNSVAQTGFTGISVEFLGKIEKAPLQVQNSRALKNLIRATGLSRRHVAAARMYCAAARMYCERQWLAATTTAGARSAGRILCYHSIGQAVAGVNDVKPEQFCRHIELALRLGFRFVPAEQIARLGGAPMDLAITFDDGWTSVLSNAAPILQGYGVPWLLFVVSSHCNHRSTSAKESKLSWREIEDLMAMGVQIGSHSVTHPDFGTIERAQMIDELCGSREAIQRRLGFTPTSFAIPYGQSMSWPPIAGEIAREAGYEFVYAQAERTRPSDTIPRTFVTRFDSDRIFSALLRGAYDSWEEWV